MTSRPASVRVGREGQELRLPVPDHVAARLGAEVGDTFRVFQVAGTVVFQFERDGATIVGDGAARFFAIPRSRRTLAKESANRPLNTWDF